jgi:uncharacterized protein (DUF2164 family)
MLTTERKKDLETAITNFFASEFDETISGFRAAAILDLFMRTVAPSVYNQGVHDAVEAMQRKLTDLDGEVHMPDSP